MRLKHKKTKTNILYLIRVITVYRINEVTTQNESNYILVVNLIYKHNVVAHSFKFIQVKSNFSLVTNVLM